MSDDAVPFTKEGIKLSYGRFLSDSAGGYVLLIICADLFARTISVPPALANSPKEAKSAAIVLAGVFILLLGPPFGLALNSLSWFLLGIIEVGFLNLWGRYRRLNQVVNFLVYHTGQEFNLALLQSTFGFLNPVARARVPKPRQSLYSQLHMIKKVMQAYFPHLMGRVEYLTGVRIFIRNLSLLSAAMAAFWPGLRDQERMWLLIATVGLTVLGCMLELYGALALMISAYSLCLSRNPALSEVPAGTTLETPPRMTFAECITALLDHAKERRKRPSPSPQPAG